MKPFNPLLAIPAMIVIVLTPFTLNFWDTPFSNSMQDWAHFGTYFAGMLTPLAGFAIYLQIKQKQEDDVSQSIYLQVENISERLTSLLSKLDDGIKDDAQIKMKKTTIPINTESLLTGTLPESFYSLILTKDKTKWNQYKLTWAIAGEIKDLQNLLNELHTSNYKRKITERRFMHLVSALKKCDFLSE